MDKDEQENYRDVMVKGGRTPAARKADSDRSSTNKLVTTRSNAYEVPKELKTTQFGLPTD